MIVERALWDPPERDSRWAPFVAWVCGTVWVLRLGLWLVLAVGLVAVTVRPVLAEGPLDAEARAIARVIQCPICENLSVLDSPSTLAQQMRAIIREKLAAGESRQEIIQYFVDRYGEGILLEPPKRGFTLFIWLGPLVVAVGGLGIVAVTLRRWLQRTPVSAQQERLDPAALQLLETELAAHESRLEDERHR